VPHRWRIDSLESQSFDEFAIFFFEFLTIIVLTSSDGSVVHNFGLCTVGAGRLT
jgi:hypothetical protein